MRFVGGEGKGGDRGKAQREGKREGKLKRNRRKTHGEGLEERQKRNREKGENKADDEKILRMECEAEAWIEGN